MISEQYIFTDVDLAVINSGGHLARRFPAICHQAVESRINEGGSIGLGELSSTEPENHEKMEE